MKNDSVITIMISVIIEMLFLKLKCQRNSAINLCYSRSATIPSKLLAHHGEPRYFEVSRSNFFNGMAVSFTSLSVIQFPYLARIRRKEQWMIKDYGIMSVMEMKYFCVAILNILNHIEYIQYSHAKIFQFHHRLHDKKNSIHSDWIV